MSSAAWWNRRIGLPMNDVRRRPTLARVVSIRYAKSYGDADQLVRHAIRIASDDRDARQLNTLRWLLRQLERVQR